MYRMMIAAALAAASAFANAQTYPAKPIRLVVPYPAGGGGDLLARPLAQSLTETLGQQVIVENRGGAGGNLGMEFVAKRGRSVGSHCRRQTARRFGTEVDPPRARVSEIPLDSQVVAQGLHQAPYAVAQETVRGDLGQRGGLRLRLRVPVVQEPDGGRQGSKTKVVRDVFFSIRIEALANHPQGA
jgi:hypothetical protein